jgi:hypothetical protein
MAVNANKNLVFADLPTSEGGNLLRAIHKA